MKLLMENWREYQKQELLKEEVDKILFLFEEGNEELLKEAILNEGAIWDFVKNIKKLPETLVGKVLAKAGDYLNAQLKKRKVKRVTRNNVIKTINSEPNIKLATVTIFALIGLTLSMGIGPQILQFIESFGDATVTQIYQAIDQAGDIKDMASTAMALPIFGIASAISRIRDLGLGAQDSTKVAGLNETPT
jgi:hypothetical protein